MMDTQPDLPKRLASRIRAAQDRVQQKRQAVAGSEHILRRSLERVEEFERCPAAFADRYYRGHDADSYPVQTTIARERERIERHVERKPMRLNELAELDRELKQIEEEVRKEVSIMKPSKGRVPWPPTLPDFATFKAAFDRAEARQDRKDAAERDRLFRQREEDDRRHAEKKLRDDAEIDALIAGMPEHARTFLSEIRNGIKEGKFTFTDFVAALQANSDHKKS